MKKVFTILLLLLPFASLSFSINIDDYLEIVPDAIYIEFFNYQNAEKISLLPSSYSNFIELLGPQNISTNEYFIFANSEIYSPKTSLYIPINTNFDYVLESITNKDAIEDHSISNKTIKKVGNIYILKEKGEYIGISDSIDVLLNKKISSSESNLVTSFRSMILKGTSQNYPYFSFTILSKVSPLFNINITNVAKYNFISDLNYLELYSKDNVTYQGKISLKSKDKIRLIYTPKVIRSINLEYLPHNDTILSVSVNPNLVADLINTFYPDISQISPSFLLDLQKTISGTFGFSYNLDDENRLKKDLIALVGVKSKSQAEKFVKSFLGLSKYKKIKVKDYQLYEITTTTGNNEEKFYITYTDKEYVIALNSDIIVNFLDNLKMNNKSFTLSKGFIPSVYLDMLLNSANQKMLQNSLPIPKKSEKIILSIEPDDSLNFIDVNIE